MMKKWISEASKITGTCLMICGLFALFLSAQTVLVLFNALVMSAAATLVPQKMTLGKRIYALLIINSSIYLGGLFGYLSIELFILSLAHLLGADQQMVSLDRVVLTIIGSMIIITVTTLSNYLITNPIEKNH